MPRVLFTSETAAEMARRANHSKRDKKLVAPETHEAITGYIQRRLTRVRKQIDKVDRMLMLEEDPQKLDRLASASSRLEEQERRLSGRFIPGSTKPTNQPKRRAWTGDTGPTPIPDTTTPSVPAQPNVISNPNPLTDNKAD